MPAISVSLDAETLGTIGAFKEAAEEVKREWKEVQNKITDDVRAGGSGRIEDIERAGTLRQREDYFRDCERKQNGGANSNDALLRDIGARMSRQQSTLDTAFGDAHMEKGLRGLDSLADSIKENRESGTNKFREIAALMNTHNPHGQLRSILSGNIREGQIRSVGELTQSAGEAMGSEGVAAAGESIAGAAAVAGPIGFVLGQVVKHGIGYAAEHYQGQQQAAAAEMGTNSQNFLTAYGSRFDQSAQTTEYLRLRKQAQSAAGDEIDQTSANHGVAGFSGIAQYLTGGAHEAQMKASAAHIQDVLHGRGSVLAGQRTNGYGDYHQFLDAAGNERQFSYAEKGALGWLKSQTLDRLTGERERQRDAGAMAMATKQVDGLKAELEAEQKRYNDDPHNRVNDRERDRWQRAVETSDIIKFNQGWNPI